MGDQSFYGEDIVESRIREYSGTVYRLAFAQTKNKSDADDIFREVFKRYIKKKPALESGEHEKAWFIRTAINCCKNLWNLPFGKSVQLQGEVPELINKSQESILGEELLDGYLLLVPQKYRIIIHLYYYEDMSTAYIGKLLNRKESTVRMQLTRAGRLLKDYMEGEFMLDKYYSSLYVKIEPSEELIGRTKERMYAELKGKNSFRRKLEYRFGIISAYLVFILLSVTVSKIPEHTVSTEDAIGHKAASNLTESSKYIKNGYAYKKGDVIKLQITFPQEYDGKEIKVIYHDYSSGESTEVYAGKNSGVLKETFCVEEDGKAYFLVLMESEGYNITDSVNITAVIERTPEREE